MFEHWTLTLAQGDSPPPTTPPATEGGGGTDTGQQSTTGQDPNSKNLDPKKEQPQGPNMINMFLIMGAVIVFMFWMTGSSRRREQKKHDQMMESLKKNDKVVTTAGIIGTIVEVREKEIILKVDESTNTRMRFTRGAIRGVIGQEN